MPRKSPPSLARGAPQRPLRPPCARPERTRTMPLQLSTKQLVFSCTSLSNPRSHFRSRTYTSAFSPSCYGLLSSPPNLSSGVAGRRSHRLRTHIRVHFYVHLSHLTCMHATCHLHVDSTCLFVPKRPLLHSIVLGSSVSFSIFIPTVVRGFVIFSGCSSLLTLHTQLVPAQASQPLLHAGSGFTMTGSPSFLQLLIPVFPFLQLAWVCDAPHWVPVCNSVALRN